MPSEIVIEKRKQNFINNSVIKHINKYDYSKVEYKSAKKTVEIVCPKHGSFFQMPTNHLYGKGCLKCGVESNTNRMTKTINRFIEEASSIHNERYDYSQSIYVNDKTKVKILCYTHGVFLQTPSHHLRGVGCPFCHESKGEYIINNYLISKNIEFIRQRKFSDCRYKSMLSFDFWIESKNILIEFDGIQHFYPVEIFGGEIALSNLKICDNIKDKYCLDKSILLLRISYLQIDNISEILDSYLS